MRDGLRTELPGPGVSRMSAQERFFRSVQAARENGWFLVCAGCGRGMDDEGFDDPSEHESDCIHRGRDRDAEMAAFLAKRLAPPESPV